MREFFFLNNKACSDDLVINEYIKSTTEKIIDFFLKYCLTLYFWILL